MKFWDFLTALFVVDGIDKVAKDKKNNKQKENKSKKQFYDDMETGVMDDDF